jgi:hypothetical protein
MIVEKIIKKYKLQYLFDNPNIYFLDINDNINSDIILFTKDEYKNFIINNGVYSYEYNWAWTNMKKDATSKLNQIIDCLIDQNDQFLLNYKHQIKTHSFNLTSKPYFFLTYIELNDTEYVLYLLSKN